MAGGFQRPDHSSAEDEGPELVIGGPRPDGSSLTHDQLPFPGCLKGFLLPGIWISPWIRCQEHGISQGHSSLLPCCFLLLVSIRTLSQQSGRPIKAELPVYAEVFPPARQVCAEPKDLLGVWESFCSRFITGEVKSLGGRVLPQWD